MVQLKISELSADDIRNLERMARETYDAYPQEQKDLLKQLCVEASVTTFLRYRK